MNFMLVSSLGFVVGNVAEKFFIRASCVERNPNRKSPFPRGARFWKMKGEGSLIGHFYGGTSRRHPHPPFGHPLPEGEEITLMKYLRRKTGIFLAKSSKYF
jgi:hypothetical protein